MSLRDQATRLAQQGVAFRQEIFGAVATMEGSDDTFACYYSPVSEAQELSPFGFRTDFDFILRVPKTETNFVPEIGKNVKLLAVGADSSDLIVRLVRPRVHPRGVEHVFECKSQW